MGAMHKPLALAAVLLASTAAQARSPQAYDVLLIL